MSSATCDTVVLRVAEIFLKGRNRRTFFAAFVRRARDLVADLDGVSVHAAHMRVYVDHPPDLGPRCVARLSRLFGLQSMSPAVRCERSIDAIRATAVALARAIPPGETFKIETKRSDKKFPIRSQAVSREVGAAVVEATGLPVDVRSPRHVIHVEIGVDRTIVFRDVIPGPGGLPVGVSGRVGLLLSGGIDSPVAGWYAMRRGCSVFAIYFHSFPYTGDKTKDKVVDLARSLARWQGRMAVRVVHFTDVQKALRDAGPAELAVLLYRRMMMRVASLLAAREGADALVTGENLGQVASQTLRNLAVIEDAASLPILRPLLTFDKLEIIERARAIGTYELSILPYDDCCSLFVPKHPATRARLEDLRAAESRLDIDAAAAELADGAERIDV
ncbi:MAG: tRNA 4-thiouridine(8) synthase ThiI [Deltaproteobacteria bacterium]|nr:MAG: tRNA 4-thiouridine(8) synthase ThiI [Deltaproteobacteria bacterium]